MDIALLCSSIFFAVANSTLLHARKNHSSQKNDWLFNMLCSGVWIILLLTTNGFTLSLSGGVVFYGILYGTCQMAFLYFKMKALETGDMSVTTLTGNSSMIVSTILGTIIWKESIALLQIVGMLLLFITLILCLNVSGEGRFEKAWKYYVILFFLCASSVGLIFKFFSKNVGNEYAGDMMIFSALVMTVGNAILCFIRKEHDKVTVSKQEIIFALLCGIVSCAYNRLNIYLSGALPSIIFFPILNGAVFIFAVLAGALIFKERVTRRQTIAFSIGGVGMLLISGIFN